MQAYLALIPRPIKESGPHFAITVCVDLGGNVVTAAGKSLSTRAIHCIITKGLRLEVGEETRHCGAYSPQLVPDFCLVQRCLSDSGPKMMQHQYYARAEIYAEEVRQLLDGAEDAATKI